jgi:hypothetical protein
LKRNGKAEKKVLQLFKKLYKNLSKALQELNSAKKVFKRKFLNFVLTVTLKFSVEINYLSKTSFLQPPP